MEIKELIIKAKEAANNAYAPYSNFKVGAALKTKDGKYFIGCNVENASYGLTNCAERSCLFSAYSSGIRKDDIVLFVIYSPANHLVAPCGACRQVMQELLNKDTKIILAYGDELKYQETTLEALLPFSFSGDDLNV